MVEELYWLILYSLRDKTHNPSHPFIILPSPPLCAPPPLWWLRFHHRDLCSNPCWFHRTLELLRCYSFHLNCSSQLLAWKTLIHSSRLYSGLFLHNFLKLDIQVNSCLSSHSPMMDTPAISYAITWSLQLQIDCRPAKTKTVPYSSLCYIICKYHSAYHKVGAK